MNRTLQTTLVLTALATATALACPRTLAAQEDRIGIALGATPPAAEVQDLDGKPVNLSNFVGHRPVVVEFWAT
ncbi:MAG: hypothetical protein Q7J79_09645, partial [Gemmatimonadales bacterium]|nr:hypothetical protein [Gemmatimonadales bacterium]